MPVEENDARFIERIAKLDDNIKENIISFDHRMDSLYGIKKIAKRLTKLVEALRKTAGDKEKREAKKKEIITKIEEMQRILSIAFTQIFGEEGRSIELNEKESIRRSMLLDDALERALFGEYRTLHELAKLSRTVSSVDSFDHSEIEKKAEKMLKTVKAALSAEEEEVSLDQHLTQLIDMLRDKILPNEKELLTGMHESLGELKQRAGILRTLENTERIEEVMTSISVKQAEIDRELRTEKRQVINPFRKILGLKNKEHEIVRKIVKRLQYSKGKITKEDIKKDVHAFVDSAETQRYIAALMRNWKFLDGEAQKFLGRVGISAAGAHEREIKNLRKAAGLGFIDGMTGLKNKRAFEEDIANIVDIEKIAPTSLAILDLDFFKGINDNYGHQIGDEVLKLFSKVMVSLFKKKNCYRWGGEEFVVMVPEKDSGRLKAEIEAAKAELIKSSTSMMAEINKKKKIEPEKSRKNVTFSGGVAEFPKHADSGEALIAKADAALYYAKSEKNAKDKGRNRIIIAR